MSLVKKCDKCGKTIDQFDIKTKTRPFLNKQTYILTPTKTIKIRKQVLQLHGFFTLACGQEVDLCHKCGWILIRKIAS